MIRLLVFLGFLLALAFGFSWLADNPGELTLVWGGRELRTGTMVLAIGLVAFVIAILAVWSILNGVIRAPKSVGSFFSRRRRERGWRALSNGMIAVGAGDPQTAGRLAGEARRVLGDEPLALLLEAQAAQLSGDRAAAHEAFERMLETPETKLLGLRGLYVEAGRYGDAAAARHFADEANTLAPRLAWAGQALLEFQSQERDWEGALSTLDRNARNKIADKPQTKRLRAVILTARALELELGDPDTARNLALEAHGLAPDLVPAAVLAGRLLTRANDIKRASRVLEATWKLSPHPELAEAYAHVRSGDSAQDRLSRIKDLIRVRAHHPECAFALARGELDARNFAAARAALKPVMSPAPTRRACLLMAEIEECEHGASGRVRGWLTRAVRAPRDPAWIADGYVSDHWMPVSPVSGRVDAFEWRVPPEELAAPISDRIDDAEEAFEESGTLIPLESAHPAAKPAAPAEPPPVSPPAPVAEELAKPVAAAPAAEPAPAAPAALAPAPSGIPASTLPTQPPAADKVVVLPKGGDGAAQRSSSYVFRSAPDDPGPDTAEGHEADEPSKRFRLFS
ncbi:heme biosynthesis protein HemY [Prosthecomicrobium sp. N25]|uniref:heme biosynthesis protein HemY n=1 Tax=Prosthecomicrobium sp. N25 TaxID=3129254 RepID=UPI003076CC9B